MGFEVGLVAVEGLEEGERRGEGEARDSRACEGLAALAQVARNRGQGHAGEDRGGDEAEDGEGEQGVQHAGLRILCGRGNRRLRIGVTA